MPAKKHPWKKWMDGEVHTLKQWVDFDSDMDIIRGILHHQARMVGKRVETKILLGGVIKFRFVDKYWWED